MKYKDPNTGEFKDLYFKTGDTLPIGTVVEYDGEEIPDGYEEVVEDYITVERKKLWENPNPTVAFNSQAIDLSSDDYDSLTVYYKEVATESNIMIYDDEILKGYSTKLTAVFIADDAKLAVYSRNMIRISNTQYSFEKASYYYASTGEKGTLNTIIIPIAIYGNKYLK